MPTRKSGNPVVCKMPKKKVLCDSWWHGGYCLDGSVDPVSLDFTISYKPIRLYIPIGKRRSVTFRCVDKNSKGFVAYTADTDDFGQDGFCNMTYKAIQCLRQTGKRGIHPLCYRGEIEIGGPIIKNRQYSDVARYQYKNRYAAGVADSHKDWFLKGGICIFT